MQVRLLTSLVAAFIGGGALGASTAVAAPTLDAPIVLPAAARDARVAPDVLWPDATMVGVSTVEQGLSDGVTTTTLTSFDPMLGGEPKTIPLQSYWSSQTFSYAGSMVTSEIQIASATGTDGLSARGDVLGPPLRARSFPADEYQPTIAVGNGGVWSAAVHYDDNTGTAWIARVGSKAPIGRVRMDFLTGMVVLADGSALVRGGMASQSSSTPVTAIVSRSGHVTLVKNDGPGIGPYVGYPTAAANNLIETRNGPYALSVGHQWYATEDGTSTLQRLRENGAVIKSVAAADIDASWPEECQANSYAFKSIVVGPAGLPVATMSCRLPNGPFDYPRSWEAIIELSASLTTKAVVFADAFGGGEPSTSIGPNGRLLFRTSGGDIRAARIPGSFRVTRGQVTGVKGIGSREARVEIECDRPIGSICSGVARVRNRDGRLAGVARYALVGRPRASNPSITRTIGLRANLQRGAKVRLVPLPA